jgi:hypothetical protein
MAEKNLAAWNVREQDFPVDGSMEDRLKFLLRYAILAPSGPNTQPWKCTIDDNKISVYADLTRSLPFVEPTNRTLYISLGCFVANLLIAAEHFKMGYTIDLLPDGEGSDRVALAAFSDSPDEPRFPDLFHQITLRHTNRTKYENRSVDPSLLAGLSGCIDMPGYRIDIFTEQAKKNQLADLLGRSHKIQLGNKDFRKDLSKWIRANTEDAWDGLPGYSFGYTNFESYFGSFIFGAFDTSTSRAQKEMGFMRSSPAVAVLSSEKDDILSLLNQGIIFEKMFLKAAASDLRFDLFSQPIGIPELREEMAELLRVKYPQLLMRIGYAKPAKHTPRRLVENILVKEK